MKLFVYIIFTLYLIIGVLAGASAFASATRGSSKDEELAQSSKCVMHFKKLERKHKIPTDLLHSISLQESGRKHSKSDKKIPWPWTVNVEGQGHYFKSKLEAVNFVKKQISSGKKSIDVGCMQISLLFHGDAFSSVVEAFDPKANIEYGALFLKEKFEQYGSWKKAIANYHSANFERGSKYQESVLRIANNIDKHKFDVRKIHTLLSPSAPLYVANYKQAPYYNKDRSLRYRSNMMVYVPKNARRIH